MPEEQRISCSIEEEEDQLNSFNKIKCVKLCPEIDSQNHHPHSSYNALDIPLHFKIPSSCNIETKAAVGGGGGAEKRLRIPKRLCFESSLIAKPQWNKNGRGGAGGRGRGQP